ncbi:hypothetical protein [Ralstonia pickettii]|uniref:hypothetical protein n=1 Tax=Ralstonia pickettii TaxID=329 RepID=UPI0015B9A282|nr:hypothetical protein [Ralstonia pickettii]NWK46471.1 hypothetical protein [Ralstonia pickettii]
MNNALRYTLGGLALTGFALSLLAHVMALAGMNLATSVSAVWDLHFGIFVVFIPFILLSKNDLQGRRSLWVLAERVPPWVAIIGAALFIYAMVNFLLFALHSAGGNPVERHGKYLVMNHGKLIREITASEYAELRTNELRGFSGHWLLFYFVPAVYFLFWKRKEAV